MCVCVFVRAVCACEVAGTRMQAICSSRSEFEIRGYSGSFCNTTASASLHAYSAGECYRASGLFGKRAFRLSCSSHSPNGAMGALIQLEHFNDARCMVQQTNYPDFVLPGACLGLTVAPRYYCTADGSELRVYSNELSAGQGDSAGCDGWTRVTRAVAGVGTCAQVIDPRSGVQSYARVTCPLSGSSSNRAASFPPLLTDEAWPPRQLADGTPLAMAERYDCPVSSPLDKCSTSSSSSGCQSLTALRLGKNVTRRFQQACSVDGSSFAQLQLDATGAVEALQAYPAGNFSSACFSSSFYVCSSDDGVISGLLAGTLYTPPTGDGMISYREWDAIGCGSSSASPGSSGGAGARPHASLLRMSRPGVCGWLFGQQWHVLLPSDPNGGGGIVDVTSIAQALPAPSDDSPSSCLLAPIPISPHIRHVMLGRCLDGWLSSYRYTYPLPPSQADWQKPRAQAISQSLACLPACPASALAVTETHVQASVADFLVCSGSLDSVYPFCSCVCVQLAPF